MALHPAEIAKEVSKYPFFAGFESHLLMQLCTMVREVDFPAGTKILSEGQLNNNLYFLRSGEADVILAQERVMTIFIPGEVMGEMSVMSASPASASVVAKTNVQCFVIQAEDFAHVMPSQKDRFNYLLYRVYSMVLVDRLTKTNEKARMFERAARDLDHAKKELEALTNSQINFLKQKVATLPSKTQVLFWDPQKINHPVAKMAIGGTGVSLDLVTEAEDALQIINHKKPNVLFADLETLIAHKVKQENTVAICQQKINFDLLRKIENLKFLITRDPEDRVFNIKSLLAALNKITNQDFFGIDKYLSSECEIKKCEVKSSRERFSLNQTVLADFRALGLRSSVLDRCQVAIEELLMNAIYDAPTDTHGRALYNHIPRQQEIDLNFGQFAELSYGCDGLFAAVAVQDPFGALTKEIIFEYLQANYSGTSDPKKEGKGGAGRGLHQIIESSDLTIFNVKKKKTTEVISLWSIESALQKRQIIPSFQLFLID